jgi:hypothetical protein
MSDVPYPSLADFAETWSARAADAPVPWAHPAGAPLAVLEALGLRPQLEDVLDTVVALQRADWLQDGVYVSPRAMGPTFRDLLEDARTLQITVPPAVVSGCPLKAQGVFGTDPRAFLHLSSFFLQGASSGERRFLAGRFCGHIAARQVTWTTCYALLVDQGGLRQVARHALGPALEILLAPMSLGARMALSHWHRAAEVTADRAGLLCASAPDGGEAGIEAAGRALLRISLGVRPEVSTEDYLEQLEGVHADASPGRWTELLATQPFLHKRLRALELFARSTPWVEAGREPVGGAMLSSADLDRQTHQLLAVT